jgi:predicted nucleic acid-binding Zn ribbon protein
MLVRCVCDACGAVYDEVVIDHEAAAAPPCPRCGAWLLRIRDRATNKLNTTGDDVPATQGLPELAAIRRPKND